MIELFYLPGAASLAPHLALEEAQATYQLVRVKRDGGAFDPPWFLDVSPHGRIPAMRFDGRPLTESAACVMHIADLHPESGLAPALGTPERAEYYRWLAYLTNTVQVSFIAWFNPDRALPGSEDAVKAAAGEQLARQRAFIAGELAAGGPYLTGTSLTGADLFLFMLIRWGRNLEPRWWDDATLGGYFRSIRERPSAQRVWEQEGLDP